MQDFTRLDAVCGNHDNGYGKYNHLLPMIGIAPMKWAASSVSLTTMVGGRIRLSLQGACDVVQYGVWTVRWHALVSSLDTGNVIMRPSPVETVLPIQTITHFQ